MLLNKNWISLATLFIVINILLSAWWLFHGDIRYDIDISRDFLVISEILEKKTLTLIGPHSGVIGGVFHGPLWYYANLPAFFFTKGDPLLIGWFWWVLSILTLIIFWIITQKIFDKNTAILATLLYSANSIINPSVGLKQFFNPYGAVVLSPIFFYLLIKYTQNKKPLYLILTLLSLGLIIQFQMAFGIPVLILLTIFLLYFLYIKKSLKHLLVLPIILLPLSTFILFDIRHNFLQTNAIFNFFFSKQSSVIYGSSESLMEQLRIVFIDTFSLLIQDNSIMALIYSLLFVFIIIKVKNIRTNIKYSLFLFFYFGFLIPYFFFRNSVNTYHRYESHKNPTLAGIVESFKIRPKLFNF